MHAGGDKHVARRTLFYYALPDMPIQIATVPVAAFIPNYYGADLGIGLAAVGLVWLIARSLDCFIDPIVGYLNDHTRTRWGRRRVWMVASLPLMMVAVYKLFLPDTDVDASYLLVWLLVLWLGWSMLMIPYYAWGAELATDYHERTRVTAWRAMFGTGGNFLSKVIPVAALFFFGYGGTPAVVHMTGIMLLVLLPVTVVLCVLNVEEGEPAQRTRLGFGKGLRIMWRNGPFRRLISAFFVTYMGIAIISATMIFYVRGVLEDENGGITVLLAFFGANLCGVPFWLWASKQLGKHVAWRYSLLTYIFVSPLYLLLGPGDLYWMLPISATTGFAGGALLVLTNSMKADVIDLDRLMSGQNRSAVFFSVWSLATKIALSTAPWLAFTTLAVIGFDPAPDAVNGHVQITGLKLMFILSTPVLFGAAAIMIWRYPLTEERQRRLSDALKRRQARRAVIWDRVN